MSRYIRELIRLRQNALNELADAIRTYGRDSEETTQIQAEVERINAEIQAERGGENEEDDLDLLLLQRKRGYEEEDDEDDLEEETEEKVIRPSKRQMTEKERIHRKREFEEIDEDEVVETERRPIKRQNRTSQIEYEERAKADLLHKQSVMRQACKMLYPEYTKAILRRAKLLRELKTPEVEEEMLRLKTYCQRTYQQNENLKKIMKALLRYHQELNDFS